MVHGRAIKQKDSCPFLCFFLLLACLSSNKNTQAVVFSLAVVMQARHADHKKRFQ